MQPHSITTLSDWPNLKVLTHAYVNQIEFSDKKVSGLQVATGVNFTVKGKSCVVSAKTEVILSTGTTLSPQIQELPGIASLDLLKIA